MNKKVAIAMVSMALTFGLQSPLQAAPSDNTKVSARQAQRQVAKIDINSASVERLTALPGIGMKKAEAIVAYRSKHGKFKRVEDLAKVKGIGDKMVEKLKPLTITK